MLLYQYLLTGWCISWISDNYYPQTHVRPHARWLAWRTFAVRPITLTHAPLFDHLTTLSLHRTRLAFVAQRTHQDVRHIARSITYNCTAPAYWRFRTCVLSYKHFFFMRTFIKHIADFFARTTFWSHPIVQQLWKAPYGRFCKYHSYTCINNHLARPHLYAFLIKCNWQ